MRRRDCSLGPWEEAYKRAVLTPRWEFSNIVGLEDDTKGTVMTLYNQGRTICAFSDTFIAFTPIPIGVRHVPSIFIHSSSSFAVDLFSATDASSLLHCARVTRGLYTTLNDVLKAHDGTGCVLQVTEWLTAKKLRMPMHQKQVHTGLQFEEVKGKHTQNVTRAQQRIALEISFDHLKDRINGKVVCKGAFPTPPPLFIAYRPLATGVMEFVPFPPSISSPSLEALKDNTNKKDKKAKKRGG